MNPPALTTTAAALLGLVKPGLFEPEALSLITTYPDPNLAIFQIAVAERDMPRLIGKHGANIGALKLLMGHVGKHQGHSVRLSVLEPMGSAKGGPPWSLEACRAGIEAYLEAVGHQATVAIVAGRENTQLVMIEPPPPEDIEVQLSRWVQVMGSPAGIRFILDDQDA